MGRSAERLGAARRRIVVAAALVAAVGMVAPGTCYAQVAGWQLGVGVGGRPDYEGSNDYELLPIGTARVDWRSGRFVQVGGIQGSGTAARISANVLGGGNWRFGPLLQYRVKRGDVDNSMVHRMPTVSAATEAGAFFGYGFDHFLVEAATAADVSGNNTGITVEMTAKYRDEISKNLSYILGVGSTWASDDYMQTYFGVNAVQSAASGLSQYKADASFKDVGVNLNLAWRGDGWKNWSIVTVASYNRLIGDADSSSPITHVGSENQFFGGLMFVYSGS